MAVDGSGNVFVTGYSSDGSNEDYLTVAYDASGSELWARAKNGAANNNDRALAVALGGNGNVYVTGYSSNGSKYDYLTVAYDAGGNELWSRVKNGAANGNDEAYALAVDGNGNVYVTGPSWNGSNYDYLTVAYDAGGNERWSSVRNGSRNSEDYAYALAVDGSGNVYVTGRSYNSLNYDYLTVAYDANGNELWARVKNGAADGTDHANDLAVSGSGYVYVTGYSSNGFNQDYLTVAYDASGNELWARVKNGAADGTDRAYALAVDRSGNVYVTGKSYNGSNDDYLTVAYGATGNELWARTKNGAANSDDIALALAVGGSGNVYVTGASSNNRNADYLTVAYDASGGELWSRVKNGAANGDDNAYALAVGGSGKVYVAGQSFNGSNDDFLTVAYDTSGSELWERRARPPQPAEVGSGNATRGKHALAVDGSGKVYVTGRSSNGSNDDFLTVAYDASGSELWARAKDGAANSDDRAFAVALGGNGNVHVTGNSWNGSNSDYLTVAYDANGNELWARPKNGAANNYDSAAALAVGGNGYVYVTGTSSNGSNSDYLTVAYDASGNELWARAKNGAANRSDSAFAVTADGAGNVYVTGNSSNGSNDDYLTVAYDSSGNELWARAKSGTASSPDSAYALAVDGSGKVYVTGYSFNGSNGDYLTVAYDSSGNELWTRTTNGAANSDDAAYALAVDGSGHVHVTGASSNGSNNDYLTVAYDASGNELWARAKNGAADGEDSAYALAVDASGNVYVTGTSWSGSSNDYLTVAYDASGNELWELPLDEGGNDRAYAIALDGADGVIVSGSSFRHVWAFFTVRISTVVDSTPPAGPVVESVAPPTSTWSNDNTVEVTFSGAADEPGGSGLDGYSVLFDQSPTTQPDVTVDHPHTTDPHVATSGPLSNGSSWYFHLSTCDVDGNCSAAVHTGPFWIDRTKPSAPGAVSSSSHGAGPSNDDTIDVSWAAASDSLSGVASYAYAFDGNSVGSCTGGDSTVGRTGASAALVDGSWYVHVCAVDAAGNRGAASHGGPYVVDTVGPLVASVGTVASTDGDELSENESVSAGVTQLLVRFATRMADPSGNVGSEDVTNPGNYRLFEAGADGVVTTSACGAAAGDDVAIPVAGATAYAGATMAALSFPSPQALPRGVYRLIVCPTLEDDSGAAIAIFRRRFSISRSDRLSNPNFDADLSGWVVVDPLPGSLAWGPDDAGGAPSSGSAEIVTAAGAGKLWYLAQCFAETQATLAAQGRAAIASVVAGAPVVTLRVDLFSGASCTGALLGTTESAALAGDTGGGFEPLSLVRSNLPAGTQSVLVTATVDGAAAASFTLSLDDLSFGGTVTLFSDGFESGSVCDWSTVVPEPGCP